jgi:uncharacterized protein YkwD
MTFLWATILAASLEADAAHLVRERFEVTGRSVPADDVHLSDAAKQLAHRALTSTAADAAGLLSVTDAVSKAGGWDASPMAILIKGHQDILLDELRKQKDLAAEPSTAMGVGVAELDGRSALCILLAARKMELAPIARRHAKAPKRISVCGALLPPLERAELFVTLPSGTVDRRPMRTSRNGLCGSFTPAAAGRHAVEVLGRGPRGPEVAALFFVDIAQTQTSIEQRIVEPTSTLEARTLIAERINHLRKTMGLMVVSSDSVLDAVAQAWASRLANEGFFSHVDPTGGDLKSRLAAANYKFGAAGENLGASSGPLAAHFGIEHSPGHRANLLEPGHRKLGIGIASRETDGMTIVVQVLATPLDDGGGDPLGAAYHAISELRAQKGLPQLARSAVLESLAHTHARLCLTYDRLSSELGDGRKLHDRIFEAVPETKSTSVDLAIVESPVLVPVSRNLNDAQYSMVGVGIVRGDSERYGKDKLWLVVVYASRDREK